MGLAALLILKDLLPDSSTVKVSEVNTNTGSSADKPTGVAKVVTGIKKFFKGFKR